MGLPVTHINKVPDTEDRLQKLVLDDKIDWEQYDRRIENILRAGNEHLMIQNESEPPAVKFPWFPTLVLTAMAIGLVCAVIFGSLASNADYAKLARHNRQAAIERVQQEQRAYLQYACMVYRSERKVPPVCK